MITAQVGGEELLGLGDGDVQFGLDVHSDFEGARLHPEQVAAQGAVLGDEVEVIAGHVHRSRIQRRPEPDQGPHLVENVELALVSSRLEQPFSRLGGTRRPE
jgi:hypothetical protein